MYSTAYITVLQQEYKIMVQKAVAQLSKTYRPIQWLSTPQEEAPTTKPRKQNLEYFWEDQENKNLENIWGDQENKT